MLVELPTLRGQPMPPARRAIILAISTTMIAGACWLLYEQFTASKIIFGWALLAGGMIVTVGGALLCEDVIAPHWGRLSLLLNAAF
jgi:hypothetical protein